MTRRGALRQLDDRATQDLSLASPLPRRGSWRRGGSGSASLRRGRKASPHVECFGAPNARRVAEDANENTRHSPADKPILRQTSPLPGSTVARGHWFRGAARRSIESRAVKRARESDPLHRPLHADGPEPPEETLTVLLSDRTFGSRAS
jgi:hypothetical protein